jgi:hypothetical protein
MASVALAGADLAIERSAGGRSAAGLPARTDPVHLIIAALRKNQ